MQEQIDLLHQSLFERKWKTTRLLLKDKTYPVAYHTLLTAVRYNAPLDIIERLWETGHFALTERSPDGLTVLTVGHWMRNDTVSFLLSKGADPNISSMTANQSALAGTYEPKIIMLLLKYGANPYHVYPDGRTVMDSFMDDIVGLTAPPRDETDARFARFAVFSKQLAEDIWIMLVLLQSQHERLGKKSVLFNVPKELFRKLGSFFIFSSISCDD